MPESAPVLDPTVTAEVTAHVPPPFDVPPAPSTEALKPPLERTATGSETVDPQLQRQELTEKYDWYGKYAERADKTRAKGLTEKEIATLENRKRTKLEKKGVVATDEEVKLTANERYFAVEKKVYRIARTFVKDHYDDAAEIVDADGPIDHPLHSAVTVITVENEDRALRQAGKDPDADAANDIIPTEDEIATATGEDTRKQEIVNAATVQNVDDRSVPGGGVITDTVDGQQALSTGDMPTAAILQGDQDKAAAEIPMGAVSGVNELPKGEEPIALGMGTNSRRRSAAWMKFNQHRNEIHAMSKGEAPQSGTTAAQDTENQQDSIGSDDPTTRMTKIQMPVNQLPTGTDAIPMPEKSLTADEKADAQKRAEASAAWGKQSADYLRDKATVNAGLAAQEGEVARVNAAYDRFKQFNADQAAAEADKLQQKHERVRQLRKTATAAVLVAAAAIGIKQGTGDVRNVTYPDISPFPAVSSNDARFQVTPPAEEKHESATSDPLAEAAQELSEHSEVVTIGPKSSISDASAKAGEISVEDFAEQYNNHPISMAMLLDANLDEFQKHGVTPEKAEELTRRVLTGDKEAAAEINAILDKVDPGMRIETFDKEAYEREQKIVDQLLKEATQNGDKEQASKLFNLYRELLKMKQARPDAPLYRMATDAEVAAMQQNGANTTSLNSEAAISQAASESAPHDPTAETAPTAEQKEAVPAKAYILNIDKDGDSISQSMMDQKVEGFETVDKINSEFYTGHPMRVAIQIYANKDMYTSLGIANEDEIKTVLEGLAKGDETQIARAKAIIDQAQKGKMLSFNEPAFEALEKEAEAKLQAGADPLTVLAEMDNIFTTLRVNAEASPNGVSLYQNVNVEAQPNAASANGNEDEAKKIAAAAVGATGIAGLLGGLGFLRRRKRTP